MLVKVLEFFLLNVSSSFNVKVFTAQRRAFRSLYCHQYPQIVNQEVHYFYHKYLHILTVKPWQTSKLKINFTVLNFCCFPTR